MDDQENQGFWVVKKIFHGKEIAEYNSNLKLISELETLKGKANSLKSSISECSTNVKATYNQAKEAIINADISLSLEKINDYVKELNNIEQSLSQGISDINNKINDVQARNQYLLGIIYG